MTCENCGKPTAEVRRVTRSVGREGEARGEAVLVEGVPPVVCRSCGERFFFTAQTLRELERIRLHRDELPVENRMPVAQFDTAA